MATASMIRLLRADGAMGHRDGAHRSLEDATGRHPASCIMPGPPGVTSYTASTISAHLNDV